MDIRYSVTSYKTNSVTCSRPLSEIVYTGNSFEQRTRPTTASCLVIIDQNQTMQNHLVSTIAHGVLLIGLSQSTRREGFFYPALVSGLGKTQPH